MTSPSLEQVIQKTQPTKPDLKYLLTKYQTNSTSLNHYEQIELNNQLTGVLKTPAIKMLARGWRSPHGSVIYAKSTNFEVKDIISEGMLHTLNKINQYNPEFSVTNFVYLKLEEIFRINILPRQATALRMSKKDYEEMENYSRETLSNPQSVEILLSERVDEDELRLSSADVTALHTCSSQTSEEVFESDNMSNKIFIQFKNTIMNSDKLSPLEKQVYYLSSGFFGEKIDNSKIEEFTNGEITSQQYKNAKDSSRHKIKRIYESLSSQYKIKHTQKPKAHQTAPKPQSQPKSTIQTVNEIQTQMFAQEQFLKEKEKEKKQLELELELQQYQISRQFPIKSKFYLSLYEPNNENPNIEDKLVGDISQIIQEPITQLLNEQNMFYTISPNRKQQMYTTHSKQILEQIISTNPDSLEEINKLIQTQLYLQIPQLKQEIETEKNKPKPQSKPISNSIRFGKSKGKKSKQKKVKIKINK